MNATLVGPVIWEGMMKAMKSLATGASFGLVLLTGPTIAHTPICNCYDNGDDTVTCEGGFSDGGSAAGVPIRVVDERDRVLLNGEMAEDGTYTFDRPSEEFHVIFDAGQSHLVTIYSADIE